MKKTILGLIFLSLFSCSMEPLIPSEIKVIVEVVAPEDDFDINIEIESEPIGPYIIIP